MNSTYAIIAAGSAMAAYGISWIVGTGWTMFVDRVASIIP